MTSHADRVAYLLERHGTTYAEQAGIRLTNKPSPLYRLLVLSLLLSARISADVAVSAARELAKAGFRTPQRMHKASWQQRVDALGRGHYRRYDERTATMLGNGAQMLMAGYAGDLRRLNGAAKDPAELEKRLQDFPGIGPAGSAIFCREVQALWPDIAPYADQRVMDGAEQLGLPTSTEELASLVKLADLPRLTAACVRAALDDHIVADVTQRQQ